jgi:hypothetical protein
MKTMRWILIFCLVGTPSSMIPTPPYRNMGHVIEVDLCEMGQKLTDPNAVTDAKKLIWIRHKDPNTGYEKTVLLPDHCAITLYTRNYERVRFSCSIPNGTFKILSLNEVEDFRSSSREEKRCKPSKEKTSEQGLQIPLAPGSFPIQPDPNGQVLFGPVLSCPQPFDPTGLPSGPPPDSCRYKYSFAFCAPPEGKPQEFCSNSHNWYEVDPHLYIKKY